MANPPIKQDSKEDSAEYTELHDITDLTKHCLLFAVTALTPQGLKLTGTGTHRIEGFCDTILQEIESFRHRIKQPPSLPETTLVPQNEVLRFYEEVCSPKDFALLVSQSIAQKTDARLDERGLHTLCWNVYYSENKADLVYPRWLSTEASKNLWLVFCSLLSKMDLSLDACVMNDILQRIFKLASYTWDSVFEFKKFERLLFPAFLEAIVDCLSALQLDAALVNEVMDDLRDEIVFGVMRKGYLFKKGHKRKNWKRRWFVLQRNVLMYHTSRDKLDEKGHIVLNRSTEVKALEDKGNRKHKFSVTCGGTSTPYMMTADDRRSRNEWMLDINKAIQLEQALSEDNGQMIDQQLARFYTLKYGTASPNLIRLDSTIRHATIVSDPLKKEKLEHCARRPASASDYEKPLKRTSPERSRSSGDQNPNPLSPVSIGSHSDSQGFGVDQQYTNIVFNPDQSTDQDDAHESRSRSSSNTDDEGYTFMYRRPAKEKKTQEGENQDQWSGNESPGTYDSCDFTPRYQVKSKDDKDAIEVKKRSITETSVELENISDFLKCTLPSSPTHTPLSIATPDKLLSSDSSAMAVDEPLPAYLDVLPRQPDNGDGKQAPPIPPRKSISASPRRKTSSSPSSFVGTASHSIVRGSVSSTSSLNSDTLPLSSPTSILPESPSAQLDCEEEQYYITPPPGPKGKVASRNVT